MHVLMAVNPTSGFGKHPDLPAEIAGTLALAGHTVDVAVRDSFDELEQAARDGVAAGADALVVVGGDGMVSLGVNVLHGTDVPLGIVAAGTGNDMARGLGLPYQSAQDSLSTLLDLMEHTPRRIDLARAEAADGTVRMYGCVLSGGFDALVNERVNRMRFPKGPIKYVVGVLIELFRFRPRVFTLMIDGVEHNVRGVLVAIANNSSFGAGMRIAPDAQLDDGLLDVVVGRVLSRWQLIRLLPKLFTGTHVHHPAVELLRGTSVQLGTENVVAYTDGERLGPLPVRVEIVPNALRVFAPLAAG